MSGIIRIQGNDSQVLKIKEISKQEGDIMYEYDDEVLNYFLENQQQLFPENVADTLEEAENFLEDCM